MNSKHFGVMLDCSRNGVMKPQKVKEFVDYIAAFGYNTLELYTEDTFEVEGGPYFGYMRGRYTIEELQDIDKYCQSKGIELIPCIQTLAHLNSIFHWNEYKPINDVKAALFIGEERTYQLIDNIFASISKAFTSKLVNIGMDEAWLVGLGKYLTKHGYQNRFEMLKGHLERVIEIAKKYGFKPIMWSDMFFNLLKVGYVELPDDGEDERLHTAQIPEDVNITYWDYYRTDKNFYSKVIKAHKILDKNCWFAGGAWSWRGFAPLNERTVRTMTPAMQACHENNVENILITAWGDDGNDCSYFSMLPTLFYISKVYQGESDLTKIKEEFKSITGEDYDEFMAQGLPNVLCEQYGNYCPSKYICFSDIFNGYLDPQIPDDAGETYKGYAEKLKTLGKDGRFAYLYDNLAKLCDFLSIKSNLGKNLRRAYQEKDTATLNALYEDIKDAEGKLDKFVEAFMKRWYIENKPQGGEVHEIRFGGLKERLRSCRNRLGMYLAGEIEEIPELAEELLVEENNGSPLSSVNMWVQMATVQPLKCNGY